MTKSYLPEIFLGELLLYLLLWLWNDYLATLISLVFAGIFLIILIISLIVEWVERSKVPGWYYRFMTISILAPLAATLIYLMINGGLNWVNGS